MWSREGKWIPRVYHWPKQDASRKKGSATFRRMSRSPAQCRFCAVICKNVQSLRWHMRKEHGK